MSQYSQEYEQQSQTSEAQPVYAPDPIDLQQFEHWQSYMHAQESSFQQQTPIPPRQNESQPIAGYPHGRPVFVYLRNEPDSLSKLAGAFSYVGGWFSAILVLLFVRHNRFIRFHALQSLFLFGGVTAIYTIVFEISAFWPHGEHVRFFGGLFVLFVVLAFLLLNTVVGISWLVGIGGAMMGKYVKLPFVGDLAEKVVGGAGQPR